MASKIRVAVTQHEPEWLDLAASVQKTCKLIEEAAAGGAKMIAFPELWIPGYPAYIWSRPVDFELTTRYIQNSLAIDSEEMMAICAAAQSNDMVVCLGFSERDGESVYISQAIIDRHGKVASKRRKMKPTHMERTIFGDASGHCLSQIVDIPDMARVGTLACWEHIQPLLKFHLISQKEQIHAAGWPPLDGFVDGSPGLYSMSTEGCLSIARAHAIEAQVYVLHCTTALSEKGIALMKTKGSPIMGSEIVGSSAVVGPDGRIVAKAPETPEQMLFVDLDMGEITRVKSFADASGHYSRPDLMWLGIDSTLKPLVRLTNN